MGIIDENEFKKIFASNLVIQMELKGKSRKELAKEFGVGYTTVCDWCNGNKVPYMDRVDRLCSYFGCKRSDLLEKNSVSSISEIDALLAKISAEEDDLNTRFMREYIELSNSQKALLLDVMRQFKKD